MIDMVDGKPTLPQAGVRELTEKELALVAGGHVAVDIVTGIVESAGGTMLYKAGERYAGTAARFVARETAAGARFVAHEAAAGWHKITHFF